MYVISEYAVCMGLIFLVALLLFAACATAVMIWEGSLSLGRAVLRTLDIPQQARRVAAPAGRETGFPPSFIRPPAL